MRHGWTLVELLIVITLVGSISVLATGMLIRLSAAQRTAFEAAQQQGTLARLDLTFRRDVHQAETVEMLPDDKTPGLRLTIFDGSQVRYLFTQHILQRIQKPVNGPGRYEEFPLPARNVTFEVGDRQVHLKLTLDRGQTRTLSAVRGTLMQTVPQPVPAQAAPTQTGTTQAAPDQTAPAQAGTTEGERP
jgi:prepilin-type N-terminal cleavage/methylation domain-containing protein